MEQEECYMTVEQSIIEACCEVNLMRKGILPKRDWREAFSNLKAELEEELELPKEAAAQ